MDNVELTKRLEELCVEFKSKVREAFSKGEYNVILKTLEFSLEKEVEQSKKLERNSEVALFRCHKNEQGQIVCS